MGSSIFLGVTLPDERVLTQITIVKDQKWGPMNDTASSVGSDQNAESAPSLVFTDSIFHVAHLHMELLWFN